MRAKELMMNRKFIALLTYIILICQLTVIPTATAAQNIEDLVNQGKLTIDLKVNHKEQQIVGQALILAIEVSTDRWFATGSQIQHFTLKNVVMQANNITTINGSKRIKGQTWATQTHEITLYPTVSGAYQIDPIHVDISVNTEHDGIVSGELSTQESSFNIELPKALEGIENFIVSPQVTLTVDGQFDEEKNYAIGEAITQTITITADNTPAMMIKPINLVANNLVAASLTANDKSTDNKVVSDKATLDGVSIYHKPAQVFDKSNRGTLLGTRIESFTYIFEKPGRYVIDEQVIYWWNSQTNTLEYLLIPSSAWTVSDGGLSKISTANALTSFNNFTIKSVINSVIIIVLLIFTSLGFIKRHYLFALYNKVTKREQRLLRSEFLNAVTNKNYLIATQYLYQYAVFQNKQTLAAGYSQAVTLNQLAFYESNTENIPLSFSVSDAKVLISKIDASISKKEDAANFTPKERINLNSD